jgi:hypothetical protein
MVASATMGENEAFNQTFWLGIPLPLEFYGHVRCPFAYHSGFVHSDLIRISGFGFRVCKPMVAKATKPPTNNAAHEHHSAF